MSRNLAFGTVATICVLAVATAGAAIANEPTFRSSSGSTTTNLDCAVKARLFPDVNLGFFTEGFSTDDGSENSMRCTARVRDGGNGRKGVKITLGGEIVTLDDQNPIAFFPPTTRKTDGNGNAVIDFPLDDLPDDDLAVIIEGTFGTRKKADSAKVDCALINRRPCAPDDETLCLLDDNRFKVYVEWRDFDNSTGSGQVLSSGSDTGSFYFFNPNNQNLLVQLFDACKNNDHFWFFASAATNVEYDLTVTDTATGTSRVYENELGQVAQAITDTSAFATCP